MKGSNRQLHTVCHILATFVIIVFVLLAPVACDNGGGGGGGGSTRPPGGDDNDWATSLASDGASKGIEALLDAAGLPLPDFLVDNVVGSIMGKLFKSGPSPETEMLNQIYSALTDIDAKLSAIATQLQELEGALVIDTSKLNAAIQKAEMDPYVNQINTLWDSYQSLRSVDLKGNVTWSSDPRTLQGMADDILACNGGAYAQLVGIHDLLTKEGDVSGGTLEAMREYVQALVIDGNKDPFACYMMIENYFGSILQAQTRASTLMVEALRYREANNNQSTLEDCPAGGNAADFMAWYAKHIEDQVEVFLNETEQFVASTAYPQKSSNDFVPSADKIFYRADLVAAWLSSRHRLDPTQPPNGQQFMVYRVIGGPDRVNQYGSGFVTGSSTFASILYKNTGGSEYDVPAYSQTSHHAYSDLMPGVSPYVQFMHPLDHNGGAKQKGAISDATEIWTGKYVVKADKSGDHWFWQPYYLNDIPGSTPYVTHYQYVNSAGGTPTTGDDKILFAYVFDIQQPPAMLMGDWEIVLTHDSQNGLEYGLAHWLNGNSTPGSQSVYLGVDAWPTVTHDQYWYYPTGNFQEENAMVGHYYWGGSTCCPKLSTNYTASMAWNIQNNGAPANRDCGTMLWVARADQNNSYGDYNYNSVGSGTDSVQGSVTINMVPGEAFYASIGAHMFVDWSGNNVSNDADWHHWQGNYTLTLQELHFTLPQ